MSVILTMKLKVDPARWEQLAQADPDGIKGVMEAAKGHALIAHRFYGSDNGEVMVVDEWPDAESFQTFFSAQEPTIGPLMQEAGATSEPEITFWRKLETGDDHGWE